MASLPTRHRPVRRPADGGYSVLEAAIVLPAVFFLLMVIVQWAIVWHARSVADAAAQEGLRATEAYTATAADGRTDTLTYLAQVAPNALPDPRVTVTRTTSTATVEVRAPVMTVIPFGRITVTETASGPVETYVSAP